MAVTYGIDVSAHQGAINWPVVGASSLATFAAVRVSVGLKPDDRWQANLAGAADHVELPMAYSVVGTKAAPADAADLLVNMVSAVADLDRVALIVDAENFSDGNHPTMTQVHAFRDALHRLTGRWPLAYIPDWWLTQHGYRTDAAPWPWWPSRYVPEPWGPVRLDSLWPPLEHGFTVDGPWQFTSSGVVAGIAGRVDRNAYAGSLDDLRALTLGADMPLSTEDLAAVRKVIGETVAAQLSRFYDTLIDGDATHPVTLRKILEAAGIQFTDAQVELLATKLAIVGHPAYVSASPIRFVPEEPTP